MARSFNGSTDRLFLNGLTMLHPGMKFTWVASIKTGGDGTIVGMDTGSGGGRVMQYKVVTAKLKMILFTAGGGSASFWTSAASVNDNKWHRVIGMYDGSVGSLFIDTTAETSSAQAAGNTPFNSN